MNQTFRVSSLDLIQVSWIWYAPLKTILTSDLYASNMFSSVPSLLSFIKKDNKEWTLIICRYQLLCFSVHQLQEVTLWVCSYQKKFKFIALFLWELLSGNVPSLSKGMWSAHWNVNFLGTRISLEYFNRPWLHGSLSLRICQTSAQSQEFPISS